MIKRISLCLILFYAGYSEVISQNLKTILKAPDHWNSEQIDFPLAFAPEIELEGFEDLRFAPGWSDPQSEEFWTYHFTWVLDKPVKLDKDYLEATFSIYFDGLTRTVLNQTTDSSVQEKPEKTISQFQKTESGFTGTIKIFDAFHSMESLTLNCKVQERICTASGKQLVSFDLTPEPLDNQIWNIFKNVQVICQ